MGDGLRPESKASVQRCTSWSPGAETVAKSQITGDEPRRKTTDSIPANIGEQLNDGDSSKTNNTALSAELAHIFGRKQSIPCGHIPGSNLDCEHCVAASSATLAAGAQDVVPASEVANISTSTLTTSTTTADVTVTSDTHAAAHSTDAVHNQMTCSTCSQALQKSSHSVDEGDPVNSIVKIARMVKRVSSGGPARLHVDLSGQVPILIAQISSNIMKSLSSP